MNEFIILKPIKPKTKVVKLLSLERILYPYLKIRFDVTYYEQQDFNANRNTIFLPPIDKMNFAGLDGDSWKN